MMDANRLDAYIDSRTVFLSRMQTDRRGTDFRIAGEVDEEFPLYIACSAAKPGSRAHLKTLDDAMVELRASGELARILSRYGLKDWGKAP
jgi:polar amino acid transport system substrate-binding protein